MPPTAVIDSIPAPVPAAVLAVAPRRILGLALWLVGAGLLAVQGGAWLLAWLAERPMVGAALRDGTLAALATAAGTLPVLFARRLPEAAHDGLLGFGAGVMLGATAFSLVLPGLESAKALGHGPWGAGTLVAFGLVGGALLLLALERIIPHVHFDQAEDDIAKISANAAGAARVANPQVQRVMLFVLAVTLHNLPEGLAIGVGHGGSEAGATALAMGIALQDIPEGFVVAMALASVGVGRGWAAVAGIASGLVEPVMAAVGAAVVGSAAMALPWGLALAGGAMLFVISHEIIPESHRRGRETLATLGLVGGFAVMMLLDTALGA